MINVFSIIKNKKTYLLNFEYSITFEILHIQNQSLLDLFDTKSMSIRFIWIMKGKKVREKIVNNKVVKLIDIYFTDNTRCHVVIRESVWATASLVTQPLNEVISMTCLVVTLIKQNQGR